MIHINKTPQKLYQGVDCISPDGVDLLHKRYSDLLNVYFMRVDPACFHCEKNTVPLIFEINAKKWCVECSRCGVRPGYGRTEGEAITIWNKSCEDAQQQTGEGNAD